MREQIQYMNQNKATGPDGVPTSVKSVWAEVIDCGCDEFEVQTRIWIAKAMLSTMSDGCHYGCRHQ